VTPAEQVVQAYTESREDVYRYVVLLGVAAAEAQEIAQETFLRLHQAVQRGEEIRSMRGWAFRVAHNLALNTLTRSRDNRSLEAVPQGRLRDRGGSPEEGVLERERMERVERAISDLSPQQRQCLYLRAEGLRYREIAEAIGVGVSTVGEFLSRAMARLQKAVQ